MGRKNLLLVAVIAAVVVGVADARASSCAGDLNGDGAADVSDLLMLLGAWGPCEACLEDLDEDGVVAVGDLLALLGAWGPCVEPAVLELELAGRAVGGFPHFTPRALFSTEQPVELGVDPSVAPGLIGRALDAYVVIARTAADWQADPALVDVRGRPQPVVLAGPDLAGAIVALDGPLPGDGGLGFGVAYDLVLDADGDGQLSDGDAIDGWGDAPGMTVVDDLTTAGPLSVSTGDLNGGVFLAQRIYYPATIDSLAALPLVVISHGNFMQHTWYDYLGNHLASHGYVVMSHTNDTMPGIDSAAVTTLNNTEYLLLNQDVILGGVLEGHLDSSRIVWIGHSRGGEGVVRAYDAVRDGLAVPTTFALEDVVLLSSIAPSSWLDWTGASPAQARYHLLYGTADGDVYGGADTELGQPFRIFERANGWRHATIVQGADHNDFNCCGFEDYCFLGGGSCAEELAIGSPEAQRVAKATYLALLKHVVEDHAAAGELLWRQHEDLQLPGVAADTIINREFREGIFAGNFVIDDFQTQTSTSVSSSGGAVTFSVSNLVEGKFADIDSSFDWTGTQPMNGMTRAGFFDWTFGAVFDYAADAFLEFEIVEPQRDLTNAHCLSFRACQGTRHPLTTGDLGDLDFSVTLRDGSGTTSTIRIGVYGGGVEEPFQRTGQGTGIGWANEFETIRVTLADFAADGTGLDLSNVIAVRLEFGPSHGSPFGRIAIDDVEIIEDRP